MSNQSTDDWRNKHYMNAREFSRQDNYDNLFRSNTNNRSNEVLVNQINKLEMNSSHGNGQHGNEFIRGQGQPNLNTNMSERDSNYGSVVGGGGGDGVVCNANGMSAVK